MGVLLYRPPVFLQALNGKLVIGFLIVGATCISVAVTVIMQALVDMVTVIVAELIHQCVDHCIVFFVTLDKELVDIVIHRLTCQQLRHEIIIAFLRHFKEGGGRTPVRRQLYRLVRVAVQITPAVIVVGKLLPVVVVILRKVTYIAVIGRIVIHVPFIQLIVTAINLIHHEIQDLDHEGKLIHHLVLVQDIVHTYIGDVVEDRAKDKERAIA